jgi:hypothetical protein
MTAAASQPPVRPATAADLGHSVRYPVEFDPGEYFSGCRCHWMDPLDPDEARAALKEMGRAFR